MKTLIPIFLLSLFFAWMTQWTTTGEYGKTRQNPDNRLFFFLLLLTLTLPVGLRFIYNDTGAYIQNFLTADTLSELLASGELHILSNPAFVLYNSILRGFTDNYHVFLMIPAILTQYAFVSTLRRYSSHFTLAIALYFCLGTYTLGMAAMKQIIATGIVLLAIPALLDGKLVKFYLLVFTAFLFHTYALGFVILPLCMGKPWNIRTLLFLGGIMVIMFNFETAIGGFLDYANAQGKNVAEYEVFDSVQINTYRVLVYSVVPLMSLFLRPYLFRGSYPKHYNLFINMAIVSSGIMSLGTINGANMFGRMANYFEIGILCSQTWIIERAFNRRSARLITAIASACFLFYFWYDHAVGKDFDANYRAVTVLEFIRSLF